MMSSPPAELDLTEFSSLDRARAIVKELGLPGKSLQLAYKLPHESVRRFVFGSRTAETIRKMLGPGGTGGMRWSADYEEPFRLWLEHTHHWKPPADMFVVPIASVEAFIDYCKRGKSRPRERRRYSRASQERVAVVIDQIDAAKDSPEFFRPAPGLPNGIAGESARMLRRLVVEEGELLPAPELTRLANSYEMCVGCGRGADHHLLFRDVTEEHVRRSEEVLASVTDHEEMTGFMELLTKSVQDKSLSGKLGEAVEIAELVEGHFIRGDLGANRDAVAKVRSRIREPLIAYGAPINEQEFLDSAASIFGPLSEEYIDEMKCRACRAVAAGSPQAEGRISEAREVMSRAVARDPARKATIDKESKDLDFIELIHATRRHQDSPEDHDAYLSRQIGSNRLQALLSRTTAPLRRAVICYWLWCANGRSDLRYLQAAATLLSERPTVNHLCVLNVASFRIEIERALRSALDRS